MFLKLFAEHDIAEKEKQKRNNLIQTFEGSLRNVSLGQFIHDYKNQLFISSFALSILVLIGLVFYTLEHSYETSEFLPLSDSAYQYYLSASTDEQNNAHNASDPSNTENLVAEPKTETTLEILSSQNALTYNFSVNPSKLYPYATLTFSLVPPDKNTAYRDFSKYESIELDIRCTPNNKLSFFVFALDKSLAERKVYPNHRNAGHHFSCNSEGSVVNLNLRDFKVPEWWLLANEIDLAESKIDLSRLIGFGLAISPQTTKGEPIAVQVSRLTFKAGFNVYPTVLFLLAFITIAALFAYWVSIIRKTHLKNGEQPDTNSLSGIESPEEEEKVLVEISTAGQLEITEEESQNVGQIVTQRDRDKKSVLKFMHEQFTNGDLSLEYSTQVLGINRNKINAILKDAVGMTFSAYLNELRLGSAAKHLLQKPDAQVAEVAYSVGYSNVSYFNKLFKTHYGCSPGSYRSSQSQPMD